MYIHVYKSRKHTRASLTFSDVRQVVGMTPRHRTFSSGTLAREESSCRSMVVDGFSQHRSVNSFTDTFSTKSADDYDHFSRITEYSSAAKSQQTSNAENKDLKSKHRKACKQMDVSKFTGVRYDLLHVVAHKIGWFSFLSTRMENTNRRFNHLKAFWRFCWRVTIWTTKG